MEATGLFIYGKTHFDNRYDDSPKTKYQFDSCNFHGHFCGVELTDRNSNTIINVFTVCPEKHCQRVRAVFQTFIVLMLEAYSNKENLNYLHHILIGKS